MAFADNLREARKRKQYSQETLAAKSGVSQSAISAIEKGDRSPSETTIRLLAGALEMTPGELIDGPKEKQPTAQGDRLREGLANLIADLSPEEAQRVFDFVSGLKSARKP